MYPTAYHERGIKEPTAKRKAYEGNALRQDGKVLAHFKVNPGKSYTAEDIHRIVLPSAPLTSARRSLSNLTSAGYLLKQVSKKIEGSYGRDICTWTLSIKTEQLKIFQ